VLPGTTITIVCPPATLKDIGIGIIRLLVPNQQDSYCWESWHKSPVVGDWKREVVFALSSVSVAVTHTAEAVGLVNV
jgi:hypothetical protein